MKPAVLDWVKAFFAACGWKFEAHLSDAEALPPEVDPAKLLDDLGTAADDAEKVLGQLTKWRPPLLADRDDVFVKAAERLDEVRRHVMSGDIAKAHAALAALQKRLHKIATYRGPSLSFGGEPAKMDEELGYSWHDVDEPQRQQFHIGLNGADDDEPGQKVAMKSMGGRPRGKHGGLQGQHVSAFVTLRESLVSACDGRTQDEAWANTSHLFEGLLDFPALGPEGMSEGLDLTLVARIRGIARGDEDVIGNMRLVEAMALYVEVRDALPGATLAPGAPGDTTGKAEAVSVAVLGQLEGSLDYPLDAHRNDNPLTNDDASEAARQMLRLVDRDAVQRLGKGTAQRHAMETFALGIAQAYPRLFNAPCWTGDDEDAEVTTVGEMLIARANLQLAQVVPEPPPGKQKDRDFYDPDGDTLAEEDQIAELSVRAKNCASLPYLRDPGPRPKIDSFSVGLDEPPDGKIRLDFTGRPADSLKDASKMGDHTCAMRLMTGAVSNALLQGAKERPDRATLKGRVEALLAEFDPRKYAPLFEDRPVDPNQSVERGQTDEDAVDEEAEEEALIWKERGDSSEAAVHKRRLNLMRDQADRLREACDAIDPRRSGLVDRKTLQDMAEGVMRLLDQRPTAVSYGKGKSDGRGEGFAGAALDKFEAELAAEEDKDDDDGMDVDEDAALAARANEICQKLLALYDAASANYLYTEVVEPDRQAALLTRLEDEFLFFARSGFPLCVRAVGEGGLRSAINKAIVETIHQEDEEYGDAMDIDEEYDSEEDEKLMAKSVKRKRKANPANGGKPKKAKLED